MKKNHVVDIDNINDLDLELKDRFVSYISYHGNENGFEFSFLDDSEAVDVDSFFSSFKNEEFRAVRSKKEEIGLEYSKMVSDVLEQMKITFGTTDVSSAQATASTMEAMLKRPSKYVGKLGFTKVQDVTDYATQELDKHDDYAIWRLERIQKFREDRDSILNS